MTERKLKKIVYANPVDTGSQLIMGCPICRFEYNRINSIEQQQGKDGYATEYGDVFRGDALIIKMSCENGHEYEVVFGFHKGYTYLFAETA